MAGMETGRSAPMELARGPFLRLRVWLSTKPPSPAEWAQIAILLVQTLAIPLTIWIASEQIYESSQLNWRTFLDERTAELDDQPIGNPKLGCLFAYSLPSVDKHCEQVVFNGDDLISLLIFTEETLSNLQEVREYADDDHQYYLNWYRGLANDLRADPLGVVSFVLSEYFCKKEENPCYEEAVQTATWLLICEPAEKQVCAKWLRESAARFWRRVE